MMCISPDGGLAATSSATGIHLWDTEKRSEISFIPMPGRTWFVMVLFNPDGKSLLYSGVGIGITQIQLHRSEQGGPGAPPARLGKSEKLRGSDDFIALEFAPDGRSLIVGENKSSVKNETRSPDIWLWPDADPSRARKLAADWRLIGYHMTKDGRWGLTSHFIDPDITVWDPDTGQRVKGLGLSGPVFFELTPDGRWILASTRDEYQLVEIGSWRFGARWQAQFGQQHYRCCAFAPDSSLVATAEPNGRVDVRSLPEGTELIHLPSPKTTQIRAMQFSAKASRLFVLTGTGAIQEWNLSLLRQQLADLGLDWKIARDVR
jgi:WD40 repeat protein